MITDSATKEQDNLASEKMMWVMVSKRNGEPFSSPNY